MHCQHFEFIGMLKSVLIVSDDNDLCFQGSCKHKSLSADTLRTDFNTPINFKKISIVWKCQTTIRNTLTTYTCMIFYNNLLQAK